MSIRWRLNFLLVGFCAFILVSVLLASWAIGLYMQEAFAQFTSAAEMLRQVEAVRRNLAISTSDATITTDADSEEPPGVMSTHRLMEVIRGLYDDPAVLAAVAEVEKALNDAEPPNLPDVDRALARLRVPLSRQGQIAAERVDRVQARALLALGLNGLLAVLIVPFGVYGIRRWLSWPIAHLALGCDAFGRGALDYRVPVLGDDELGALALQLNEMAHHLKESRQALVERERLAAVGEICSSVAHGIRNPLSGMVSSAEILLDRGGLSPQDRSLVGDILEEGARLEQRINRLLSFARSQRFEPMPVDLALTLKGVMEEAAPAARAKGIRLNAVARHHGPYRVMGDPDLLANAVLEVIQNALEQPSERGRVDVELRLEADVVEIRVRDFGAGFTLIALGRATELFYTTKPRGSGFGLASTARCLRLHQGNLLLGNHPEGGAEVVLRFPATQASPEDHAAV